MLGATGAPGGKGDGGGTLCHQRTVVLIRKSKRPRTPKKKNEKGEPLTPKCVLSIWSRAFKRVPPDVVLET